MTPRDETVRRRVAVAIHGATMANPETHADCEPDSYDLRRADAVLAALDGLPDTTVRATAQPHRSDDTSAAPVGGSVLTDQGQGGFCGLPRPHGPHSYRGAVGRPWQCRGLAPAASGSGLPDTEDRP